MTPGALCPQKVPKVQVDREGVSVHLPPLCPQHCPLDLHQAAETSSHHTEGQRGMERHLLGRFPPHEPVGFGTSPREHNSAKSIAIPCELQEVQANPIQVPNIPRVHNPLQKYVNPPPCQVQGGLYIGGGSVTPPLIFGVRLQASPADWDPLCHPPSNSFSTTSLLGSLASQASSIEARRV